MFIPSSPRRKGRFIHTRASRRLWDVKHCASEKWDRDRAVSSQVTVQCGDKTGEALTQQLWWEKCWGLGTEQKGRSQCSCGNQGFRTEGVSEVVLGGGIREGTIPGGSLGGKLSSWEDGLSGLGLKESCQKTNKKKPIFMTLQIAQSN